MTTAEKEAFFNKYSQIIPFYYAPSLISIKELNLGKTKINEREFQQLLNGLSQSLSLTGINLWSCELTDQQIESLSQVISKSKLIKELNIGSNPKITSPGYLGHLESSLLSKLVLAWNKLGNEGANHLASYLTKNIALRYLDISAVDIQDEGLAALISALKQNNTLTHLNLQNNNISNKSFPLLSDLLQSNKGLTYLSLRALNLGDEGVSILTKGLSQNKTLTTLDLQNNGIENNAFSHLLKILSQTHLQHLLLQWNNISNGYDVLCIIPSSKIVSVSLLGNKMKQLDIGGIEKEISKLVKERK